MMPDPPALAPEPAVSVVVATHNRALRLARLLQGLRGQTLPAERFEVIVVDDGSADATQHVLAREREHHALRLCMPPPSEHLGPAGARNIGWRLARAPLVAFTDDDCVPTPAWLETLLAAAASSGGEAIVRGRTLPDPAEAGSRSARSPRPSRSTGPARTTRPATSSTRGRSSSGSTGSTSRYPSPAGEDSDLGARAVAAGGLPAFAPGRRWCTTPCPPAGPAAALRDALTGRERRARLQGPSLAFAATSHAGSSTTARIRCCCWPSARLLTRRPLARRAAQPPLRVAHAQRLRSSRRPPASRGLLRPLRRVQLVSTLRGALRTARSFSDATGASPVPSGAGTRMARDGEAVVAVVERTL